MDETLIFLRFSILITSDTFCHVFFLFFNNALLVFAIEESENTTGLISTPCHRQVYMDAVRVWRKDTTYRLQGVEEKRHIQVYLDTGRVWRKHVTNKVYMDTVRVWTKCATYRSVLICKNVNRTEYLKKVYRR